MNKDLILKWIEKRIRCSAYDEPSGCHKNILSSLIEPDDMSCNIGIIHEHRFAFYYWAEFYKKFKGGEKPILISIDYHDDVGCTSDYDEEDLKELNLNDMTELSMFCNYGLRSLNDGQVLPALYLNFFSDVFVLLKQYKDSRENDPEQLVSTFVDKYGNNHVIKYFYNLDSLMNDLRVKNPIYVYLDMDLDYFICDEDNSILCPEEEINEFIKLENPLFQFVMPKLVGYTIALEPTFCGGLTNSLELLKKIDLEFFDKTLCKYNDCKWSEKVKCYIESI